MAINKFNYKGEPAIAEGWEERETCVLDCVGENQALTERDSAEILGISHDAAQRYLIKAFKNPNLIDLAVRYKLLVGDES